VTDGKNLKGIKTRCDVGLVIEWSLRSVSGLWLWLVHCQG